MGGRKLGGLKLAGLAGLLALVGAACGTWRVTATPSPVRAVHVALLHTGKVLLVAGSGANQTDFDAGTFKTSIWDPETETFQTVATPWDAFCSGHAFLPDGRLLGRGGHSAYPEPATNGRYAGTKKAYVFDPTTVEVRGRARHRRTARWYPTVVELGDGRLLTVGGFDENRERTTRVRDLRRDAAGPHRQEPPALMPYMPMYPALHLMRDGRALLLRRERAREQHDAARAVERRDQRLPEGAGNLPKKAVRDEAMSVLLPPAQDQRVMVIGGGAASRTTRRTNHDRDRRPEEGQPEVQAGPPLDGREDVRERGDPARLDRARDRRRGVDGPTTATTRCSTPRSSTQDRRRGRKVATHTVPRVYHSSALLLPDGRVATFGGNPDGSFEMRIEIYTPHYLEKGRARRSPAAPTEIHYGGSTRSRTTQASPIRSAVLVRPAAVTHSSDSNQRLVDLPFTPTRTACRSRCTGEPNLAPPGWYMLFVVDGNGVPSVANWVHLS